MGDRSLLDSFWKFTAFRSSCNAYENCIFLGPKLSSWNQNLENAEGVDVGEVDGSFCLCVKRKASVVFNILNKGLTLVDKSRNKYSYNF